jgi:hypothetical protein
MASKSATELGPHEGSHFVSAEGSYQVSPPVERAEEVEKEALKKIMSGQKQLPIRSPSLGTVHTLPPRTEKRVESKDAIDDQDQGNNNPTPLTRRGQELDETHSNGIQSKQDESVKGIAAGNKPMPSQVEISSKQISASK